MNSLHALLQKPFVVMGIVNVTPDSFYDGGRHNTRERAVAHGRELVDEGADILDIGGESSRPGAPAISEDEECRRVLPVIEEIAQTISTPISIDTTKAGVADKALEAGAAWINDISAGRFDEAMPRVAARHDCPVVLMHSRGRPENMQHNPGYHDVIGEIGHELMERVRIFTSAGVRNEQIVLDPGIGFGKLHEHNIEILRKLPALCALGYPVLIGTSRKSLIGRLTGKDADRRLAGSLATIASSWKRGIRLFRVHDAAESVDFLKVLSAIEDRTESTGGGQR